MSVCCLKFHLTTIKVVFVLSAQFGAVHTVLRHFCDSFYFAFLRSCLRKYMNNIRNRASMRTEITMDIRDIQSDREDPDDAIPHGDRVISDVSVWTSYVVNSIFCRIFTLPI